MFSIPIALFIFKREKTVLQIIKRLKNIEPDKIYLISDGGRTPEEKKTVKKTRQQIEMAIDWDCNIIKNYSEDNRGVFQNIGLGAKWVLEREKYAIFLEDDNLPELSFFQYCEELLKKYNDDDNILWICGTNYLGKYEDKSKVDYYFTQSLLPCGWASWGKKFLKYYDEDFTGLNDKRILKSIKDSYLLRPLYHQQIANFFDEYNRKNKQKRYSSWDYQMEYSLRKYNKFGIIPKYNQICNIGADQNSIHGGVSLNQVMTKRFCELPTYNLTFPMKHPENIAINPYLEKKLSKIILYPFWIRLRCNVIKFIKRILNIDFDTPLKLAIQEKITVLNNKRGIQRKT